MMPSGKYIIGDLCYVLSSEEWDEVCNLTIKNHICKSGEFTLRDGRKFAMYQTMHGDGGYKGTDEFEYSVDSGSLGCILVQDASPEVVQNVINDGLCSVVQFSDEFSTGCTDGVIIFGHISIDTDEDEDDDDDEEYDWWECQSP